LTEYSDSISPATLLGLSNCIARSPRRNSKKLSAHGCTTPLATKYAAMSKKARAKKKKYSSGLENLWLKKLAYWAKNTVFIKKCKFFQFFA
jgi:hypothetical protein